MAESDARSSIRVRRCAWARWSCGGWQRTDESLVRANLKVVPGQPLDPEALFESQRELLLLGLFRTVSVRLISPDTPEPVKDVVVEARERPRLSGSIGVGYSLEDGPRIIGDLVYPNVFGEGINFTFHGKLNYVGWSALPLQDYVNGSELQGLNGLDFIVNAGLSQPRIWQFLPAKVGARLTFTAERVHRPTYFFGRVAGALRRGLDHHQVAPAHRQLPASRTCWSGPRPTSRSSSPPTGRPMPSASASPPATSSSRPWARA